MMELITLLLLVLPGIFFKNKYISILQYIMIIVIIIFYITKEGQNENNNKTNINDTNIIKPTSK